MPFQLLPGMRNREVHSDIGARGPPLQQEVGGAELRICAVGEGHLTSKRLCRLGCHCGQGVLHCRMTPRVVVPCTTQEVVSKQVHLLKATWTLDRVVRRLPHEG